MRGIKVFLFLTLNAFGVGASVAQEGWTNPVTITRILTEGPTDTVRFLTAETLNVARPGLTPNTYSGGTCHTGVYSWIMLDSPPLGEQRRARMYNTALLAMLAGKKVTFYMRSGCHNWEAFYISAIEIFN